MNSPKENLPLDTSMTCADVIAALGEATGFDDQRLLKEMPLLAESTNITIRDPFAGMNDDRVEISCDTPRGPTSYFISLPRDGEASIQTFEHDVLPAGGFPTPGVKQ